ncbi:hypothetical protein ACLKMY_15140 [Paraburkholderia mimosarum]|uniref:hypothetical protein n=1 Tax=Paraburkholderia mimosarum TaxID=312026 RepID=UPI0039C01172
MEGCGPAGQERQWRSALGYNGDEILGTTRASSVIRPDLSSTTSRRAVPSARRFLRVHGVYHARLFASATAQIRERHVARFKEPNLFGKMIRRSVVDNLVVDQEVVTRTFADGIGEIDVLAVYQIENRKIEKTWFKMSSPKLAPNTD